MTAAGTGAPTALIPSGPWLDGWYASDCLAVMDATATEAAVLAGICGDGVLPSVQIAAAHPERVLGLVALAPGVPHLVPSHPWRVAAHETFDEERDAPEGWEKENRHAIRADQRGFLEFFFGEMSPEPHSTKQIEDAVAYGLDGSAELLVMDDAEPVAANREEVEAICGACAVLCSSFRRPRQLPAVRARPRLRRADRRRARPARRLGAHPATRATRYLINRLMHEFAARFAPPAPRKRGWRLAGERPRRALLASSPIGLGHAWRDVAIARELRRIVPGLEVDWLAQPPVTTMLEACGELLDPASADLAPEAAGVDGEAGEHALHAFQMLRRLDEIFCANFMVFHDLVREEAFDVWIGDEAWEIDYFLHENPELKTAPYVWLTDFVGVLPMPDGGEHEAFLAADTNRQMVEHVARNPGLRDRSIFVGDPDDIVPERLAPELAGDPRLDGAALRLHRLHHRLRPGRAGRSRRAPRGARLPPRREGLRRRARRLRRGHPPPAARGGRLPGGEAPCPRAAHDPGRRPAHRRRLAAAPQTASRPAATCTSSTGSSPPVTWRSPTAGCPPRWS